MARKAQWPPRIKRHKGGQAVVRVAGRDHWLGAHGSPEAGRAYDELVEKLSQQRRAREQSPPGRERSVSEAVAAWVAEVLPGYSQKEQEGYRTTLTALVRVAGHVAAATFGPDDLETVRDAMCSGSWLTAAERRPRPGVGGKAPPRKARGGWSRPTVNRRVSRIRTVWRWLEKRRLVPRGSWFGLRALAKLDAGARGVRQPIKRRTYETGEVIRAALAVRRGPVRLMLLVQLWSGMRSGEVRSMCWSQIDRSREDWVYTPPQHKNAWRGQSRAVVLGPKCRAVLALAAPGRGGAGKGDLVFPCRGKPYRTQSYAHTVTRAAGRVGLPGLRPYDARHAARQRVTRAMGLDFARAFLGQKSLAQTNEYGDSLDLGMALDVARRAG